MPRKNIFAKCKHYYGMLQTFIFIFIKYVNYFSFNFINKHNLEAYPSIVIQNITGACKRVSVEGSLVHPKKTILSEMNNHIISLNFTISDAVLGKFVFKRISFRSPFSS